MGKFYVIFTKVTHFKVKFYPSRSYWECYLSSIMFGVREDILSCSHLPRSNNQSPLVYLIIYWIDQTKDKISSYANIGHLLNTYENKYKEVFQEYKKLFKLIKYVQCSMTKLYIEKDDKNGKKSFLSSLLGNTILALYFSVEVKQSLFLDLLTKSLFCSMNRDKKMHIFLSWRTTAKIEESVLWSLVNCQSQHSSVISWAEAKTELQ